MGAGSVRLLAAGALLWMGLALAGCSGDSSASTPPATATPQRPAQSPLASVEREAVSPDPYFDYGFTVQITAQSFRPQTLVAPCCQPITWRNLTTTTVTILFDALQVSSGPIAPGGTFVFTPKNVESIAYHSVDHPSINGLVQVNQTIES